jgi:acetyl esterase/lipase
VAAKTGQADTFNNNTTVMNATGFILVFVLFSCLAPSLGAASVIHDIAIPGGSPAARMDVYQPEPERWPGLRPTVLMIHGGGWAIGDKADRREQITGHAFAEKGLVVVSLNYDLFRYKDGPWKGGKTHEAWPRNLQDVAAALCWLKSAGARAYKIDSGRVALLGYSAGAHLALMGAYALHGDDAELRGHRPADDLAAVRAVISVYGTHDLRLFGANIFKRGDAGDEELLARASPVTYLRKGLPPTLVVHGDKDVTIAPEIARAFASRLGEVGVRHELVMAPGRKHGFALGASQERECTGLALKFLEDNGIVPPAQPLNGDK